MTLLLLLLPHQLLLLLLPSLPKPRRRWRRPRRRATPRRPRQGLWRVSKWRVVVSSRQEEVGTKKSRDRQLLELLADASGVRANGQRLAWGSTGSTGA